MNIFTLFATLALKTDDYEKGLNDAEDKTKNFSKNVSGKIDKGIAAAKAALIAGGSAAVATGAKFVSMAVDSETAFAQVNTLLSTGTDTVGYFNDIMAASNATGVSIEDYSSAVYGAISASVDQADAVKFVADANKLAKGGFTDITTATDVLTTAINAYSLSADDAAHISDVLIGTQNAGKTTVDELAQSMGKVIPIANANNVAIEELSAMYAVMTKNGVATAEAGTGIKAMLGELSKTGSKSDIVIRRISEDMFGQAKSFAEMQAEGFETVDILDMLSDAAEENGLSMADMFGSQEAAAAAMVMIKDGGKDLTKTTYELTTAAGATESAYKKMAGTMAERANLLKNSFKNVGVEIGEGLMPITEELFGIVAEHSPQIVSAITGIFSVLGDSVGWVIDNFPTVATLIVGITAATTAAKVATLAATVATDGMTFATQMQTVAQQLLNKTFLANPIGIVIAAITALVAAFTYLWNHSEAFRNFWIGAWEAIKNAAKAVADWIPVAFTAVKTAVMNIFGAIKDNVMAQIGNVKQIFNGLVTFVKGVFTGDWRRAWSGVTDVFRGFANGLSSIFRTPINYIIDLINGFLRGLNGIQIPDWVPGVGGKGFHVNLIPHLAKGGILEKGQIGLLEGNGAEAVVPLENNRKWIDAVARQMDYSMEKKPQRAAESLRTQPTEVTIHVHAAEGQDEKRIATEVAREFQRILEGMPA